MSIVKSIRLEQNYFQPNPLEQPNGNGTTNNDGHATAGDPFRTDTDTDISSGVSNQNDDLVEAGNTWTAVEGPGAGASGGGLEVSSRGGCLAPRNSHSSQQQKH